MGLIAGYYGKLLDTVIMRTVDAFSGNPKYIVHAYGPCRLGA